MILALMATILVAGKTDSTAVLPKVPPTDTAQTKPISHPILTDTVQNRAPDTSWVDLSARPDAPKSIDMNQPVGEYYLYWNTVYTLYISIDGVAVIEPPLGYTVQTVFCGNTDLFPIQFDKNRVTVKKKAFDDVQTNIVVLLTGPGGDINSVTLIAKGGKTTSSINRFIVPTNRTTNRVVEQIRSKYIDQMNTRLQGQEETLTRSVWETAISQLEVFRIPDDLDDTQEDWKGASMRLDAVVNSRDEGFIYMSTDANDRECQVVDLLSVEGTDGVLKKRVELFRVSKGKKRTQLIYRTSRMSAGEWVFKVKIWSREFELETELQLTEDK